MVPASPMILVGAKYFMVIYNVDLRGGKKLNYDLHYDGGTCNFYQPNIYSFNNLFFTFYSTTIKYTKNLIEVK